MAKLKSNPEIVEKIKASFTGIETGKGKSEGDIFNETLPEGLTAETVKAVSDHVTVFTAAGMEAAGTAVAAAMKKDKKLDMVDVTVPLGDFGNATYGIYREKEVTVPPAEKGGEPTKKLQYGSTKVDVTFVAGKNSGLLGQARAAIKEDFSEKFGPKK